jgi:hypothetical protein
MMTGEITNSTFSAKPESKAAVTAQRCCTPTNARLESPATKPAFRSEWKWRPQKWKRRGTDGDSI